MKRHFTKLIIAIAILVILASASIASASNGAAVYITPYWDVQEFHVSEGDFIYIRAGWAACSYGLAHAFTNKANIILETPQTVFVSSRKEAKEYWAKPVPYASIKISDCIPNTETLYRSWWDYPIGYLDAGEYDFHLVYWLDRPFPDGWDGDGDGKAERKGLDIDTWFKIFVE